jgi:hypothetical protein
MHWISFADEGALRIGWGVEVAVLRSSKQSRTIGRTHASVSGDWKLAYQLCAITHWPVAKARMVSDLDALFVIRSGDGRHVRQISPSCEFLVGKPKRSGPLGKSRRRHIIIEESAVTRLRSADSDVTEEPLEEVFCVQTVPRLYSEGQLPLRVQSWDGT